MTGAAVIRVLVVDDHTLFRRGLIALLAGDARFQVVAEAGDANEAHQRAAQTQPDVILLDNHMPGVNGVDALSGFKAVAPQARVLMLTVSEDERDLGRGEPAFAVPLASGGDPVAVHEEVAGRGVPVLVFGRNEMLLQRYHADVAEAVGMPLRLPA